MNFEKVYEKHNVHGSLVGTVDDSHDGDIYKES